jgi:hypothetical protein
MTNPVLLHSFRHRENLDGTWDSICMRCYGTAAHSHERASLGSVELQHHCNETNWLYKEADGTAPLRTATGRRLSVMRGGLPAGLREQTQSQANY